MIISNLEHITNVSGEVVGGGKLGFADAYSGAHAKGKHFAATYTSTYTNVYVGKKSVYASSSSSSNSSAS